MNVQITVVLSGEGADLRALLGVEDAIKGALDAMTVPGPGSSDFTSTYPHHRNGSVGVVLTAGNPPERKPRIATPGIPHDEAMRLAASAAANSHTDPAE